ncbi:Pr6Pr family membrane protein [Carnobacteriaceae bacterium zg-ZUI78]|nr:Pr6Pr family membrane protein [Carnobacteriaceae bacterium zg-ZUI78]
MTKQKGLFLLRLAIILSGIIGLAFLLPDKLYKFTYYTNISNLLVVLFYMYLLYLGNKPYSQTIWRLKGGITICITLTFLVYAILLAPKAKAEDFYHIKNFTLHYIVPILTIFDWLISDKKGQYKKSDPFLWTVVPLIYCIFSLIKGFVFHIPIPEEPHSPYPYFFINIDKYGWNGFFTYFTAILVLYILLGYIMVFVKRLKK